ncbi:MAG: sulfotransferase [Gammaproteobacteria bacterium]|nr:sulfotransferase [Gammaproteobacteria bacterium]
MSLKQAIRLHEQGNLRGAELEYRRVLAGDAGCHEALHGLGLIMHQNGRHELGISLIGKALELYPGAADYHYHLAEVLRAAGRCDEAVPEYREAIRLAAREADYYFGLGNALAELGSDTESVQAYQQALRLDPEDAELHNNLGNGLAAIGDIERAVEHLRRAVTLSPGYAEAHHNLALVLEESGSLSEAVGHARRACEVSPDRAEALANLGRLLDRSGDTSGAVWCYRKAVERAVYDPALLASIAKKLRMAGYARDAAGAYQAAIEKEPANPVYRAGHCHCLIQLHRFAEAEAESRRALELEPDCPAALGTLAVCLQTRGRFDDAVELLRLALRRDPTLTEAAYLLAANGGYDVSDGELELWEHFLDSPELSSEKRCHLHFAVAKAYERRGRYDTAFRHFQQANGIKARLYPFDARRHGEFVERIMATFTPDFFEQRRDFGIDDARPVFVIGMPRSGSTLVEQILSRHPDVSGMGEHPEMREIMRELPGLIDDGRPAPECCSAVSAELSRTLARRYLASIAEPGETAVRICDKMLGNFLRLGLIALLFPRARVVNCVRNPLDTCVSCFTQDFAQGLRFTTDLEHLALFHRSYRALLAHWRHSLPLPILDVKYESLVEDLATVSRELVEFCGLPWDDACLDPHLGQRDVATASVWQARQPVYTSSIERWRRYEKHLGPLIDGLREAGIVDAA